MKKTSIFSLTAALMMTANLYAQSSYKVTVNPNICYQTIADFGSSDCWTADFVGKYFSDAEKEKSAKWPSRLSAINRHVSLIDRFSFAAAPTRQVLDRWF